MTERERRAGLVRYWAVVGGLTAVLGSVVVSSAIAAGMPKTRSLCTFNIEGAAHGQVATDCQLAPFCNDRCQQDIQNKRDWCAMATRWPYPHYEESCFAS